MDKGRLEDLRAVISRLAPAPCVGPGICSTGRPEVDALLGGGFARGRLAEVSGVGKTGLALGAAAVATGEGRLVAYIDGRGELYPPSAEALGVLLERLLWVRPPRDVLAVARAAEIVARSRAFDLVILDLPDGELGERPAARLRAAAQGCALIGLCRRSGAVAGAALRLALTVLRGGELRGGEGRRVRVTLLRGGPPGNVVFAAGRRLPRRYLGERETALLSVSGLEIVPPDIERQRELASCKRR